MDRGQSKMAHPSTKPLYQNRQVSLYALRMLINLTSIKTDPCTYFASVHSHICYGIIFWGNSPSSKLTFKIQKRIIRILSYSTRTTSCRPLYKALNIMLMSCGHIFETITFVKQVMLSGDQLFKQTPRYTNTTPVTETTSSLFQHPLVYHLIPHISLALDYTTNCQNPSNKFLK